MRADLLQALCVERERTISESQIWKCVSLVRVKRRQRNGKIKYNVVIGIYR